MLVAVFTGDITMRPPVVIMQQLAIFMFKVKKIENLRYIELSSLSKFTSQLGATDKFLLPDFKFSAISMIVSYFFTVTNMEPICELSGQDLQTAYLQRIFT